MAVRPAGFVVDVPVTLSVAIRGADEETAKEIAREFAESLVPSEQHLARYHATVGLPPGVTITDVAMESSPEDSCDVLEDLDEDEGEDGA
jgi:hypothetical protein